MAGTLGVDDAAFHRAQDQIAQVHDDLRAEQRSLENAMRSLLGGGWRGVAADEYADGWAEWGAGCTAVLDGLSGMHEAMSAAYATLHESDDRSDAALALVHQRLGGLPGATS